MQEQTLQAAARKAGIHHNTLRASVERYRKLGDEQKKPSLPPAPWEGRE